MPERGSLGKAAPLPATFSAPCSILQRRKEPREYVKDSPAAVPGHTASTQPPLIANGYSLYIPLIYRVCTPAARSVLGRSTKKRPHRPGREHRLFRKGILEPGCLKHGLKGRIMDDDLWHGNGHG